MPATQHQALCKAERLSGKKQVDTLFSGGAGRSMSIFPIRLVYVFQDSTGDPKEPQAKMMVSVSKRYFKHAVQRNRVKRQLREAYRRNKHLLLDTLAQHPDAQVLMAFIWTSDQTAPSADVESRMKRLLLRLGEKTTATLCKASDNSQSTSHEP